MEQNKTETTDVPEELFTLVEQLKDPKLHSQATEMLRSLREHFDVIAMQLSEMLNDPSDRQARFSALMALGNLGPDMQSAIPTLRRIVQEDSDDGVRYIARAVLENLDGTTTFAMVERWLARATAEEREVALELLWNLSEDPNSQEQITRLRQKYLPGNDR